MVEKTRLFSKGELCELHLALRRERMLPVARIAVVNIPLSIGDKFYRTELYFINRAKSIKIDVLSKIPHNEIKTQKQLYRYFGELNQ